MPHINEHDVVFLIVVMKVAMSIVEFYGSIYALYLKNGDPVIGATLTFIHKTVSTNSI